MKLTDLVLIIAFSLLFFGSIFLLLLIFINKRKAGKLMLNIKDIKFKRQRFILAAILLIVIFNFIGFLNKPDLSTLIATTMLFIMFSTNVVLQYFGIGIFENGVMFGGVLHPWQRVTKYSLNNDILLINIQRKNNLSEFQYKCILDTNTTEVQNFLASKIK